MIWDEFGDEEELIMFTKNKLSGMYQKLKEENWDLEPEIVKEVGHRIKALNMDISF